MASKRVRRTPPAPRGEEPAYTLYGSQGSGSCAAELALVAAGVPHRIVRASSWEPDSAIAELEKLNPLRQIPTLVLPDGSVMTESAAILIHLGLEYPDAGILPAEPARRAQAMRGLVFIAANCYSIIGIIDAPQRWCEDADGDDDLVERIGRAARERLHHNWGVFAAQFPATPFLSGEMPGGLDFLAVVVSRWGGARAWLRKAKPRFHATLRRIERHARVRPVFERHFDLES